MPIYVPNSTQYLFLTLFIPQGPSWVKIGSPLFRSRPCHQIYMTSNKGYKSTVQWSLFSLKSRTFRLGQTNWADKFWGIWGIFGKTISTHFGTVSPLAMFSIIQPLFLQKNKPLYPHPNKYLGLRFEFGSQRI